MSSIIILFTKNSWWRAIDIQRFSTEGCSWFVVFIKENSESTIIWDHGTHISTACNSTDQPFDNVCIQPCFGTLIFHYCTPPQSQETLTERSSIFFLSFVSTTHNYTKARIIGQPHQTKSIKWLKNWKWTPQTEREWTTASLFYGFVFAKNPRTNSQMLQRHVLICSGKMNPVKMHSAETNNNSKVIDITQLKMPRRPTLGTENSSENGLGQTSNN